MSSSASATERTPEHVRVRVFVSSPGDVADERIKASQVFERLRREFLRSNSAITIDPYFWEHTPMLAHAGYQEQIESASDFDVLVCLFWRRLGTPLNSTLFKKVDGGTYASGTEYELLNALKSRAERGTPEVLVYRRRPGSVTVDLTNQAGLKTVTESRAVDEFLTALKTARNDKCAINEYNTVADFDTIFETHMREVFQRRVPPGGRRSGAVRKPWKASKVGSPYCGLRAFDFEHADIFFGRDREVSAVLARLREQAAAGRAFVLVFGSSGVGKSSLVRAGVLPRLVDPRTPSHDISLWRRVIFRPSEANDADLFGALASALGRGIPELGIDDTTCHGLATALREEPNEAGARIERALAPFAHKAEPGRTVEAQPRACCALVLDQLEELFTVERLAMQRDPFLRAIDALARSGCVWVLATLRSDFYPRCEESHLLVTMKETFGEYQLCPPDKAQIGAMIREPAFVADLVYEEHYDEEGTVRRLFDLLSDDAASNPHSLPLLEFALDELYRKLDPDTGTLLLSAYDAMKGVAGALGTHAEESFNQISDGAKKAFDKVFRKLVTINAIADSEFNVAVRRHALKASFDADADSRELVDRLIVARLLVADCNGTTITVSVAHEAMLRSWDRLSDWIGVHRDLLKSHGEVKADATRWLEGNRSDGYLYEGSLLLDKGKTLLDGGFLNRDEEDFVHASLRHVAGRDFMTQLHEGGVLLQASSDLRAIYPDLHRQLLQTALREGSPTERAAVATLLGLHPLDDLSHRLITLLKERDDDVRHTAASSLLRLDCGPYFSELVDGLGGSAHRESFVALANLCAAADIRKEPTSFEVHLHGLRSETRWRIQWMGRALRVWRSLPTILVVFFSALMLSVVSAGLFKALPGQLNYAFGQADAGGVAAAFQGVLGSVVWGGIITLSITMYIVGYERERDEKSWRKPIGTLVAGAIGGVVSSSLILVVMMFVCDGSSLIAAGWTGVMREGHFGAFVTDVVVKRRYAWPYLILGTGVGTGMAVATNGFRASAQWKAFLERQSVMTSGGAIARLVRDLIGLVRPYGWPILLCSLIADGIALYVLRSAPVASGSFAVPWRDALLGGMSEPPLDWKVSPWGQGLSLLSDSTTQDIGGFFCVVGIAVGLVVARHGVKFDAQKE